MDEYWLNTLFTSRFVYWPNYDLLGVSGYKFPGEIENWFDGHFTFQNSSDQDYDYETWPAGIDLFATRINRVKMRMIATYMSMLINLWQSIVWKK